MLIIIDAKMPSEAKHALRQWGDVLELVTNGITYDAVSGHPDIFFCHSDEALIVSPGLPDLYYDLLRQHSIDFIIGHGMPGSTYPASARYNAVISGDYVIHNLKCTDPSIRDTHYNKVYINVNQGYTRCNLLPLGHDTMITSDHSIESAMAAIGMRILYVPSGDILLSGMPHGFFGGSCGIYDGKIFISGSLSKYCHGNEVVEFVKNTGYEIIELYPGPLVDVGSILFLEG